jgi:hypothetical protein
MKLRGLHAPLLAALVSGCAGTSSPYGAPPETNDPWELIHHARGWLDRGRPRAAVPSLRKAELEAERLGTGTAAYAHVKAAIHNERGRVHVMVSDLDTAEAELLSAAAVAESVPERRPLHFDIAYNLSAVYEGKARKDDSCVQLQRAVALHRDLLAHPAEPPDGYGAAGERFITQVAAPRIEARAQRIGCGLP